MIYNSISAWNKMAHYHYYHGSNGQQDKQEAVRLYFNAAIRGDPQVRRLYFVINFIYSLYSINAFNLVVYPFFYFFLNSFEIIFNLVVYPFFYFFLNSFYVQFWCCFSRVCTIWPCWSMKVSMCQNIISTASLFLLNFKLISSTLQVTSWWGDETKQLFQY